MIVKENDGLRIDSYLANELDLSRSKVQKLIKDGLVLVNGNKVSNSYTVKLNDEIEVNDDLNYDINVEPEDIKLDIVYEDDDLLIINKASGMVVHPAPGHYTGTLVNALLFYFGKEATTNLRPGIVHRLDKDTSGLMLVAKNDEMLDKLSNMISKKEVERKYLAIVDGLIKHDTGEIDAPIGRDVNDRQKMAVTDQNAKEAITAVATELGVTDDAARAFIESWASHMWDLRQEWNDLNFDDSMAAFSKAMGDNAVITYAVYASAFASFGGEQCVAYAQ